MSEKRFEFYSDEDLVGVLDIVTGRTFNSFEIVDWLNEQQAIIQSLKEENEQLKKRNKFLEEFDGQAKTVANLKAENEQLKQKLENLGLNEKNDMVEYSIEDFFRWLQRIKKEFEDFEDNGD